MITLITACSLPIFFLQFIFDSFNSLRWAIFVYNKLQHMNRIQKYVRAKKILVRSLLNDSWNFAEQPDVIQDTNKFNKTENEMFYWQQKAAHFNEEIRMKHVGEKQTKNWQLLNCERKRLAKSGKNNTKMINDGSNWLEKQTEIDKNQFVSVEIWNMLKCLCFRYSRFSNWQ